MASSSRTVLSVDRALLDRWAERGGAAVASGRLPVTFLAHYTGGASDFEISPTALGRTTPEPGAADDYQRLGTQLVLQVVMLEQELASLRSGRLLRVVLQTEHSAVFCLSPFADQHLVGVLAASPPAGVGEGSAGQEEPLPGWDRVAAGDRAMRELADELRAPVGLSSRTVGGGSGGSGGRPPSSELGQKPEPDVAPAALVRAGPDDSGWAGVCASALDPADLHYLALFHRGGCDFALDVLGDGGLYRFFAEVSVEERRRMYQRLGVELEASAGQLARVVHPCGGLLHRLVLDVEEGCLYYYRVPGSAWYLVAATLDHTRSDVTDARVARLVRTFRPGR